MDRYFTSESRLRLLSHNKYPSWRFCSPLELAFINWRDLNSSFLNYCLVTRYLFYQASRGPLHKAAIRGEYKMVKIRVECGEDVDQRDQVLVFSS